MDRPSAPSEVRSDRPDAHHDSTMTLRGARVEIGVRRASRAVGGLCLVALVALAAVFFAVGADKNSQITELRQHGVPVEVTVTKCLGLLGGSGSNVAGYACNGTYVVDGRRYTEAIPGDTYHAPGAKLDAVASPNDPGLVSTASDVASERTSWRVFILPTVLLVVFVVLVVAAALRRRSAGSPPSVTGGVAK